MRSQAADIQRYPRELSVSYHNQTDCLIEFYCQIVCRLFAEIDEFPVQQDLEFFLIFFPHPPISGRLILQIIKSNFEAAGCTESDRMILNGEVQSL